MVTVFLIPGSKSHLTSISEGIPLSQVRSFLEPTEISKVEALADQRVRVWGALPTKTSTWKRMKEDDWFLFTTSGTGLYEYCGKILTTCRNPGLARRLEEVGIWPHEGRKYEYIFFLKGVKRIAIKKKTINEMAGWGSLKTPQQLMRIADPSVAEKIANLLATEVEMEKIELKEAKATLEIESHTDAQGLLVELGNLLGYETYVADPSKPYKGKTLGDIASLKIIPEFTYTDTLDITKRIDVIWFKNDYPELCFEVEHNTNVTEGLLRLYQISPLRGIKFFVIAPSHLLSKFENEISKRPFREIKDRYLFRSYSELKQLFEKARTYYELKKRFLGNA